MVPNEAPFCYMKDSHLVNVTNRLANNLGIEIDNLNVQTSNSFDAISHMSEDEDL